VVDSRGFDTDENVPGSELYPRVRGPVDARSPV